MPRIMSWNTGGDFARPDCLARIEAFLGAPDSLAVLIQEGGAGRAGVHGGVEAHAGVPTAAIDPRCTCYVLVRSGADATPISLARIGDDVAGRAPASVSVDGVRVVSWHASVKASGEDTSTLLRALRRAEGPVLVGGDFKADAAGIDAIIAEQTASRAGAGFAPAVVLAPAGVPELFVLIGPGTAGARPTPTVEPAPGHEHAPVVVVLP